MDRYSPKKSDKGVAGVRLEIDDFKMYTNEVEAKDELVLIFCQQMFY